MMVDMDACVILLSAGGMRQFGGGGPGCWRILCFGLTIGLDQI